MGNACTEVKLKYEDTIRDGETNFLFTDKGGEPVSIPTVVGIHQHKQLRRS